MLPTVAWGGGLSVPLGLQRSVEAAVLSPISTHEGHCLVSAPRCILRGAQGTPNAPSPRQCGPASSSAITPGVCWKDHLPGHPPQDTAQGARKVPLAGVWVTADSGRLMRKHLVFRGERLAAGTYC